LLDNVDDIDAAVDVVAQVDNVVAFADVVVLGDDGVAVLGDVRVAGIADDSDCVAGVTHLVVLLQVVVQQSICEHFQP
jgi:hypothetical protein